MAVLLADLVADLKASLGEAARRFAEPADADFVRHLRAASLDFGRVAPVTMVGSLSLDAGVSDYPQPAGFVRFKLSLWERSQTRTPKPWEASWCGPFPQVRAAEGMLILTPAPTGKQIAVLGGTYRFYYYAGLVISDTESTVQEADRGLLLLRAQAEAMRELAMRDSVRPVKLHDGFSGMAKSGTPAALAKDFLAEFERLLGARL